ncbi:hypothetical protein BJ165DRAFT_189029 [Panaeolus papilionaceus]|nr:hypothetical protein BJ165DRAFT_189029 [Panaeolus papilionaceus]
MCKSSTHGRGYNINTHQKNLTPSSIKYSPAFLPHPKVTSAHKRGHLMHRRSLISSADSHARRFAKRTVLNVKIGSCTCGHSPITPESWANAGRTRHWLQFSQDQAPGTKIENAPCVYFHSTLKGRQLIANGNHGEQTQHFPCRMIGADQGSHRSVPLTGVMFNGQRSNFKLIRKAGSPASGTYSFQYVHLTLLLRIRMLCV